MGKSQELYKRAKKIIPGGTQLLSKRPEMFLPELWPAYYLKAKGCQVWDLDGNKYIDMSFMGIGACILGYADDDVNAAVKKALNSANMCTLNAPEEVELAELLIKLHPWAQMVRYARTGGEAMAVAVRIARARAKRDVVLFCGYHGWHDWYLSANLGDDKSLDGHLLSGLSPKGVPRQLKGTAIPFNYNDINSFRNLIKKHRGKIGAVVLETIRNHYPQERFLNSVRKITKELGVVLIFDEITSGWRLNIGGAHLLFGIEPDIAVLAKGLSNGFPMAAILGKKQIMEVAQDTFISSTYWTDRIGPAAAIASIKKMKQENVPKHLIACGRKVKDGWRSLAEKYNLEIDISGIDPLAHFAFKEPDTLILKTLFTQLMLERGFLASTGFYASFAHKNIHIEHYLRAVDEVFGFISKAISRGNPGRCLKGPVCHAGFKRLT